MLNHNIDNTAMMPCNPSIGGPAKGHLVREVSALGGEQARAADASALMIRWLNTSKGAAVRALRAQCDPKAYSAHYLWQLQTAENLDLHQDEAVALLLRGTSVAGVETRHGVIYEARAVVLCSGVYGGGVVHIGDVEFPSGPMGQSPTPRFFDSLRSLGLGAAGPLRIGRMRTDTTPRLNIDTIDLSLARPQRSEEAPLAFDVWGVKRRFDANGYACWFSHTTPETHEVIAANIHRSPLYTGKISTLGPRYCPSIEDKFLKFPDRQTHPIVFEPISPRSKEVYVQNFSTGLPYDVQVALVRTLPGCRDAKIIKPGYAIEYFYIPPEQMAPTLENKELAGFFCAGQVNGTSGYEEAAAQGLLAGINAALAARDEEQIVLSRSEAYLGVLVDDLTTKSTNEPYRMLTSRCEHRLLMRHDNADRRLTPIGRRVGLVDDARWDAARRRWEREDAEMERLSETRVPPTADRLAEVNEALVNAGATPIDAPVHASVLLKRNLPYSLVEPLCPPLDPAAVLDEDEAFYVETELRYSGYIARQEKAAARMANMDRVLIPADFDYRAMSSLSAESAQKLAHFRPRSLGAALRISGVTPADVELLSVAIRAARR
jgi:tRNA uridine 5-carboxymethylaminomethyl modification enzyme